MDALRAAERPTMRTAVVMLFVLALPVAIGCGRARRAPERGGDWRLVYPPEVADEHYPKGIHLLGSAPIAEWGAAEAYASRDACEAARAHKIDETIDQARADHGDAAKFELPVRRAVNARCIASP